MAAGNFTLDASAKLLALQGSLNLSTSSANIFGVLVTNTDTPAPITDSTYASISANEASGTGYTAGGQVMTGVSLTGSAGTVTFTTAAITWASSTISARYLFLVRRATAGTASSSDPLIGFVDLVGSSANLSTVNGSFTVTPNASGWFTLT
jgi:hypothetical protein